MEEAAGTSPVAMGAGVLHAKTAAARFTLTRDFTVTLGVPPNRYAAGEPVGP